MLKAQIPYRLGPAMTKQAALLLDTPRCRLRPLGHADARELHALWTHPEVRRFLWDGEVIPLSQTRDLLSESCSRHAAGEYGLWAATLQDQTDLIGFSGFWPFHEPRRVELLFGLSPDFWGRGYATEIAAAMITYGREHLGMKAVLASTDEPNPASVAVLERLGFHQSHHDPRTGTLFFEQVLNSSLG